jgi:SAM-dependent methyltransferase
MNPSQQTNIITARYAKHSEIKFTQYPPELLFERYLSKVMLPADFNGKSVLEIGAGCSSYAAVFLANNCKKYYANDLIPQRLAASRIKDHRYIELPGNFLEVDIPQPVDIIFSCLTMMFIIPMLNEFIDKIHHTLDSGGHFISMDPNYFCPLSFCRRFADSKPNPARLFSPFHYADAFRYHGFKVEALVPFTASVPWTKGSWLLGTNFFLKVRKK